MQRLLVIALIACAVWAAGEVYEKGVDGAFGGLFARVLPDLDPPAERRTPDRAADAFQRAWDRSEARVDHLLEEHAPGE